MLLSPQGSPWQGGSLRSTFRGLRPWAWSVLGLPLALGAGLQPAVSQQSGYGQTMGNSPVESQIYNYDPASGGRTGSGSGGLNPANPLDLINKIRKSSAMDDATPPGDAIDQALKELEAQTAPQAATKPATPLVASPRPSAGPLAAP